MHSSVFDANLNSISVDMVATIGNQDESAQFMLFYTNYTNYNHKLLAEIMKPVIAWDKFKGLALKKRSKVF